MHLPLTGATQYHAQLGLSDKGRAIKELVVSYNWDLEPLVSLIFEMKYKQSFL